MSPQERGAPKYATNHPGVECVTRGESEGSDYRWYAELRDGWKFTCGRAEGCSTLFSNNRAEFDYACAKATGTQP